MKVQIGEIFMDKEGKRIIYPNKTHKYLVPCFKSYGAEFEKMYAGPVKIAVGIGDMIVADTQLKYEQHLFILLDTTIAKTHFIAFLDWIKEQDYYEDDYVFDNIQKSVYHMVVIKIPEACVDSFEKFSKGAYSEMYTLHNMEKFFQDKPEQQKILVKDHNYKIQFVNRLNEEFGVKLKTSEYDGEVDFPPTKTTDYFNH